MTDPSDRPSPLILNDLSLTDQIIVLYQLSNVLTEIVLEHGGRYDKDKALLATARRCNISISQMPYVLTYAKAEKRIAYDSETKTLHAAVSALEVYVGVEEVLRKAKF